MPAPLPQTTTQNSADPVFLVNATTGAPYTAGVGSSAAPSISQVQGAGAMAAGQISVATTSTLIAAARSTRNTITVVNHGTTPVYLGNTGVTTGTGFLLPGVLGASMSIETTAALYGVVGTGTQTVSYLESY